MESMTLRSEDLEITPQRYGTADFPIRSRLHASTYTSNRRLIYPSASPHRNNAFKVVQEC